MINTDQIPQTPEMQEFLDNVQEFTKPTKYLDQLFRWVGFANTPDVYLFFDLLDYGLKTGVTIEPLTGWYNQLRENIIQFHKGEGPEKLTDDQVAQIAYQEMRLVHYAFLAIPGCIESKWYLVPETLRGKFDFYVNLMKDRIPYVLPERKQSSETATESTEAIANENA